ncbi:MAG TPA: hypothetical protein VIJ57_09990 [Hanamia sp.]
MEALVWKVKSIERAAESKQLKKRIKELTHSRNVWKQKSIEHKSRADFLEKSLKKTKELISAILLQPL